MVGVVGVLLAGAVAAAAHPAAIIQPDWMAKPDADDLARNYPRVAAALGLGGRAVLSCEVDGQGVLTACNIPQEEPHGLGFGQAALDLAPAFRMRPMTRDGQPVAGGSVRIPIAFRLPTPGPVVAPETPPAAAADIALAKRVLAVDRSDIVAAAHKRLIAQLNAAEDDIEPTVRAAAIAALEPAQRRAEARIDDAMSINLASRMTHAELVELARNVETPAFEALNQASRSFNEDPSFLVWRRGQMVTQVRTIFCRSRDCNAAIGADPATVSDGDWAEAPSDDDVTGALPPLPRAFGISGRVRLDCQATVLGLADDCRVVAEAPVGLGFASAALKLAGGFRLTPEASARIRAGSRIKIDMTMLSPDPAIPRPDLPAAKGSLEISRRIVTETGGPAIFLKTADSWDAWLSITETPGVTPATRAEFAQAVRGAINEQLPLAMEDHALWLSAYFDDKQLSEVLAIDQSPATHKLERTMADLNQVFHRVWQVEEIRSGVEARAEFCAHLACGADAKGAPTP
jgi:TonB family protein